MATFDKWLLVALGLAASCTHDAKQLPNGELGSVPPPQPVASASPDPAGPAPAAPAPAPARRASPAQQMAPLPPVDDKTSLQAAMKRSLEYIEAHKLSIAPPKLMWAALYTFPGRQNWHLDWRVETPMNGAMGAIISAYLDGAIEHEMIECGSCDVPPEPSP